MQIANSSISLLKQYMDRNDSGDCWYRVSLMTEELNTIADSLLVMNVANTVELGLVDALLYTDQILDTLKNRCGLAEDKKPALVSLAKYSKAPAKTESVRDREKIAVVYAVGEINSGEGDDKTIGSAGISKALREVRLDKDIKAVVFRINSPGGSALASDIILREAELLAKEKPLIVSMGDLAASGGYYIACKATRILANPNTITGSIGVFGVMPNMEKMLKNKLGLTSDRVNTNAHSDYMSPLRPMDNFEYLRLQLEIDRIYDVFKNHVANGTEYER
jgi:protease IV